MLTKPFFFIIADVGGFFGNPDADLLVRWYQTGSFQPFFRAHAHLDTKRREPWLFGDENTNLIRAAIRRRYELLPFWYTLFHEHSISGAPVMRPLWAEFPTDVTSASIDSQFMLGDSLLVAPVLKKDVTSHDVYFPGSEQVWYDQTTWDLHKGAGWHTFSVTMSSVPVFQRGGTIIPRKMRVRRASSLMKNDPYTLFVALDKTKTFAKGNLYVDDRMSLEYEKGSFLYMHFELKNNNLKATSIRDDLPKYVLKKYESREFVEAIIILGFENTISKITINDGNGDRQLHYVYDEVEKKLIIKKPGVNIGKAWDIQFHY